MSAEFVPVWVQFKDTSEPLFPFRPGEMREARRNGSVYHIDTEMGTYTVVANQVEEITDPTTPAPSLPTQASDDDGRETAPLDPGAEEIQVSQWFGFRPGDVVTEVQDAGPITVRREVARPALPTTVGSVVLVRGMGGDAMALQLRPDRSGKATWMHALGNPWVSLIVSDHLIEVVHDAGVTSHGA